MRRFAPYAIPFLLIVDFVTLIIAIIVFFNQEDTNERLHDGLCRANGIVIERVEADAAQSNPETFETFFPDVPKADLDAALARQKAISDQQVKDLSQGCSASELAG